MADPDGLLHVDSEEFSLHSLDVISQETSRAHKCVYILRTIKGAHVSIVPAMKIMPVFRLVASLGKYTFRIQKPSTKHPS